MSNNEERNLRLVWDTEQPDRLDPEVKAKWLEALHSGEYPQTQGCLQRTTVSKYGPVGYCCLGVLADTLVDDEEKIVWQPFPGRAILAVADEAKEDYVEEDSVLPEVLAKQLGITVDGICACWEVYNHEREVDQVSLSLTGLNDEGFTFSQIADVIEYFL